MGTSKTPQVLWAKQQLCTCITLFCKFLCRLWTTAKWNDQILSWLENGKGMAMHFALALSVSLNSDAVPSLQLQPRYNGEKVSKDAASPLSDSRKFKIPRRRRPRKRGLKSEFAFFQSLSRLLQLIYLVKCKRLFLSRIPKNYIQAQKEEENLAFACLRPP